MKIRAPYISKSIAHAITNNPSDVGCLPYVTSFFRFFHLRLSLLRPADFVVLRSQVWGISEDAYISSFDARTSSSSSHSTELIPIGDLGYSGSTFFTTPDGRFLIKSLPRRFEYAFFTEELFDPYWSHMTAHPDSLLVRITDMPHARIPSLGGLLGTAPTHHIVMENLLFDEGDDEDEWETFDLKPENYFFPERDIADGALASDEVIDNLVDTAPSGMTISKAAKESLLNVLREDTELLASHSAVDYSFFLARRKIRNVAPDSSGTDWRQGVPDVSGEYIYRGVILDFFWAKSRLAGQAMSGLVDAYNVVADHGPMSITAEPGEYRERFTKMVDKVIAAAE